MELGENILQQDLIGIAKAEFVPWERLRGKTILVTGATGLIGFNMVAALLFADRQRALGLNVVALVRDGVRARERFSAWEDDPALRFAVGCVEELPDIGHVDLIIHGASQTSSKAFVSAPVETILTAVHGTENLLNLARSRGAAMVYLSSMEVYGHPAKGHKVREDDVCALSPLDVRNSYPVSKLQCESLCRAYAEEYGLQVTIARLTQTFGTGVSRNDGRVFAYFGRCIAEGKDIVLKTRGETERSYLYTADAVTAILTVLLKGQAGEAYNVADEATYCSIAQMAESLAAEHGIRVRYELEDERANGYPSALYMDLDTAKLRSLGWHVLSVNKHGGGTSACSAE